MCLYDPHYNYFDAGVVGTSTQRLTLLGRIGGRVRGLFAFTISSNSLGGFILGGVASVASTSFALAMGGGITFLYMPSILGCLRLVGDGATVAVD